jgi:hypothetical protein
VVNLALVLCIVGEFTIGVVHLFYEFGLSTHFIEFGIGKILFVSSSYATNQQR